MAYDSFSTYGGAGAAHEDTGQTKAARRVAENAPDRIRFMVVSGFLGAGKTTAMIALGEYMDKNYGHIGLIANDLGANLVDTNLTQTSGCTVEEIASGCICYQMDNTIDKIRRLKDRDDIDTKRIFITDSGIDESVRQELHALVASLQPFEEILHTQAGCTVSQHCGPGCMGILYYHK